MKKLLIVAIALLSFNCATFRHNTVPVQGKLTSLLEEVSSVADKSFNKVDRQAFAKEVMVPAIDASLKVNDCLLNNNCKELLDNTRIIAQSLLIGVTKFAQLVPDIALKQQLIDKLNSAIAFVNNLQVKREMEAVQTNSIIFTPAVLIYE